MAFARRGWLGAIGQIRFAKPSLPVRRRTPSSPAVPNSLPWGSLPAPNFGAIRNATDLTAAQMDGLIREYLPQDRMEVCKERNKLNKSLDRMMKQKKYSELETQLEQLRTNALPLDEVTYVTMVFGHLQLRNGSAQVEAVVADMNRSEFIHPSLKRLVSNFVTSLRSLEQFDAFPNRTAILKAYLPFVEIATEIRKLRILGFRVAMDDKIKKGELFLSAGAGESDKREGVATDQDDDDQVDDLNESLYDHIYSDDPKSSSA